MSDDQPEPTAEDFAVAYECLRKVPYDVSPVQHVGRLIARYRVRSLERQNVCEVCGDCLQPDPPRCERHAHTEPGDPEWEDDGGVEGALWRALGDADHG